MRKTISKEELQPGKFLHFCYHSALGKPILWLSTRRVFSKIAGAYLDSRFSKSLIKGYTKRNNIDLSQYEEGPFPSFNAFFTRRIRPELRPVDMDPGALVSPCDAKLTAYRIDEQEHFEIKGQAYTLTSLLRDEALAAR